MASIHHQVAVEVAAHKAWQALRLVGDAHKLFAPVLVDSRLEEDIRTVRFANGMVLRERIIDIDEDRRRVAYSAMDGPGLTFHHASMQIVATGPERCHFIWITDFLPAEARTNLIPLIKQGANALKDNLEHR